MDENEKLHIEKESASTFVSERIKEKPVNKKKLFRRTSYIVVGALVFGIVACITFLVLEPVISNMLYPEKIEKVNLPDEEEEVAPTELLTEKDAEEEMTEAAREAAEKAAQSAIESAQASGEAKMNLQAYENIYDELYAVAKNASASLVEVTGVSKDVDWFQETIENENSITGVVIADNGVQVLVAADANHLSSADSLSVTFYDGSMADATLLSKDNQTGIGIFAVEYADMEETTRKEFVYATLGNSNRADIVGKLVIAVGSPLGDYGSISYGVITSDGNTLKLSDATYKVFSTDIYGSSQASGVLIDTEGKILGFITKDSMESGNTQLISAIAISDIKTLIEKLSNDEEFAYVGIHGMDVTNTAHKELGIPFGAYVTSVDMESPAMNVGITKGDIVVKVGDKDIYTFKEYHEAVMALSPDDVLEFTVNRYSGGEYREIVCQVNIGEVK